MTEQWVGGRLTVTSNEQSVTFRIGKSVAILKAGNEESLLRYLYRDLERKGVGIFAPKLPAHGTGYQALLATELSESVRDGEDEPEVLQ